MSLDVMARAWKHSRQSGSALLTLLALSSSADDDGVIWLRGVTVEFIGSKARTKKRQTQHILRALEDAGEVYAPPAAGRGHTTRYFVTIGLDQKQIVAVLRREYLHSAADAHVIADALIERQTAPGSREKKMQPRASFTGSGDAPEPEESAEKVQLAAPIKKVQSSVKKPTEKVQSSVIKGAIQRQQNGRSTALERANSDPIRSDQEIHDPPPPLPPTESGGGGGQDSEKPTRTDLYYWLRENGVDSPAAALRNQHHDLARTQATHRRIVGDSVGDDRKRRIGRLIAALDMDGPDAPRKRSPDPPPARPPSIAADARPIAELAATLPAIPPWKQKGST